MKRVLEGMDSFSGRAAVIILGACLTILTILFGFSLIVRAVGPSWGERCIEAGGVYTNKYEYSNIANEHAKSNKIESTVESCTLATP